MDEAKMHFFQEAGTIHSNESTSEIRKGREVFTLPTLNAVFGKLVHLRYPNRTSRTWILYSMEIEERIRLFCSVILEIVDIVEEVANITVRVLKESVLSIQYCKTPCTIADHHHKLQGNLW